MKQNYQIRYQPQERQTPNRSGQFCQINNTGGGMTPGEPLAMVYSPEQTFTDIYEDEEGLSRGTIFADLYFPFEVCGGVMR